MNNMLDIQDVTYKYPDGTKALSKVNLSVEKGKMVSLLGPNGAGKSTLFLHFNGIFKPYSGKIFVDGNQLGYSKEELSQVRQKVGIVFQNPDDQLFAPTVEEDVAFGPRNMGLSIEEVEKRVKDALERVGMPGYEKKQPHNLSGGQKKRIAIAGILAMKPELMVLDEPTSGLDPRGASKIMKLLYELNDEGMTIIVSTHDVDLVPLYSDKVNILSSGQIIKSGTPKEVFADVEMIRAANLRLPRITHLMEILNKRNNVPCDDGYPLTISEARIKILSLLGLE